MGNAIFHIKATEALLADADCAFSESACKIITVENLKTDIYTVLPSWLRRGPGSQDCGLFHFDSCFSLNRIKQTWQTLIGSTENAINSYVLRLRSGSINQKEASLLIYSAFGIALHKAQDFYAHSNWVELLSSATDKTEVLTWEEAVSIASSGGNPVIQSLLERAYTVAYRQKIIPPGIKTHKEMNIDGPDTAYARILAPCAKTYYELALAAASKTTLQWLQKLKDWINDEPLWRDLCGCLMVDKKTQKIYRRELREVLALSRYGKKINPHTVFAYLNWHNSSSDVSKQAILALIRKN